MNDIHLGQVLDESTAAWENEVVESEEAAKQFRTDEIGRYYSALANEANLRHKESAWLV